MKELMLVRLSISIFSAFTVCFQVQKIFKTSLPNFFFFVFVQVQLSPLSPHQYPRPQPSPPPTLDPTPLWLCPCVLYTCSLMTLPLFPPLSPSPHPLWSLSVCSLFKCLWFYFAHLLVFVVVVVDQVPLIGEIMRKQVANFYSRYCGYGEYNRLCVMPKKVNVTYFSLCIKNVH